MIGVTKSLPLHRGLQKTEYGLAYCGLCKAIGCGYSQPARLGLSRDIVFLLECLTTADQKQTYAGIRGFSSRNCFVAPGVGELDGTHRYCAAVNLLASGYLVEDRVVDDDSKRAKLARRVLRSDLRAARQDLRMMAFPVSECDRAISELRFVEGREFTEDANPREAVLSHSAPMEQLYGAVFRHGALLTGREVRLFEALGRNTGRVTYLIDAIRDLASDRKLGKPNPLLAAGDPERNREFAKSLVREALEDSERLIEKIQPMERRARMISSLLPRLQSCGCNGPAGTLGSRLAIARERTREWHERTRDHWCQPGPLGAGVRFAIILLLPIIFAGATFGHPEGVQETLAASSSGGCCDDCCNACCADCCNECCNECCDTCCGGSGSCQPCGSEEDIAASKRRTSCWCGSCIVLLVVALVGTVMTIITFVSRHKERSRTQQLQAGLLRGKVYRISRDGVDLGAWGSADIQSMVASGQLLPSDHCWSGEMTESKPISEVFPSLTKPEDPTQVSNHES